MNRLNLALCAALLLTACGEKPLTRTTPPAAREEAPRVSPHGELAAHKYTHFGEHSELFVEIPPLSVGTPSRLVIHLTALADFSAIPAATVTARLGTRTFHAVADQPGLFVVEIDPAQAGKMTLDVEVVTQAFGETHRLGPLAVHAQRSAAQAAAHEEEQGGEAVTFSKEQQWKVDFATAEAVPRPLREALSATGTLRARPDGEAWLTAPLAGQIQPGAHFPRLGETVKKGQVLVTLSPRLGGETDLASLRAALRKTRVEAELSRRERERLEALYRDEAVPEKRLLAARAAEQNAHAELDAAVGRLDQYGGASPGVPLRAPVSGVIAEARVAPGAWAEEGTALFHIADRRTLWLELHVPENQAARLTTADGAFFEVDGMERGYALENGSNARLVALGSALDSTRRTLPVVFEFTAPDPRLRIGMAVKALLFVGTARRALSIPITAVVDDNGVPCVYVLRDGEAFVRRPVRLGSRDGTWVEVLDGVEPGQRVVSRGAWLVRLAAAKAGEIGHGHSH